PNVVDVRYLLRSDHICQTAFRVGTDHLAKPPLGVSSRWIVERNVLKCLSVIKTQIGKSSLADPCCVLQQGSKHRLQLAGRRTDDLEDVSGGRLLLERFAQLAEQARVFDGNNGLRSKVCDKFNLFIRESPNFLTVNAD